MSGGQRRRELSDYQMGIMAVIDAFHRDEISYTQMVAYIRYMRESHNRQEFNKEIPWQKEGF